MRRGLPHREGLSRRGHCRDTFPLASPPTHLLAYSPAHPLTYSPTRLLAYSPTRLLTHSPTHPLTYSPTHLLTYSPTHLPTYSPAHLLTYSPTHLGKVYVDVTAPARRALAAAACAAEVFDAAAAAGTHVAGGAEGAEEAERGAQPGGVLARNAFRAGHSGQVVRCIDEASERWWSRAASEWRDDEVLLAAGALVVSNARREVTRQLGFTCSAGVAPNKLLAKLCGGLHKPDQQTLLAPRAVSALLDPLPVDRLRGFGGKLGRPEP